MCISTVVLFGVGERFRAISSGANVHLESTIFFFNKCIYLFIYFCLRWVFVAVRGLSLVAASGGYSSFRCLGFSLRWLL